MKLLKPILFAVLLAAIAPALFAQVNPATTYTSIDSYRLGGGGTGMELTGIIEGQPAATTQSYLFFANAAEFATRCERLALMVMSRPGQFKLELDGNPIQGCRLTRVP